MKETKGIIAEFKAFIARGNVLDMAVGIIIGSAFTAIVTSLVNDIIMPIVGVIIGGIDFSGLKVTVGSAAINYGVFIQAIINFLLIALTVFIIIKALSKAKRKQRSQLRKSQHQRQRLSCLQRSEIFYRSATSSSI